MFAITITVVTTLKPNAKLLKIQNQILFSVTLSSKRYQDLEHTPKGAQASLTSSGCPSNNTMVRSSHW